MQTRRRSRAAGKRRREKKKNGSEKMLLAEMFRSCVAARKTSKNRPAKNFSFPISAVRPARSSQRNLNSIRSMSPKRTKDDDSDDDDDDDDEDEDGQELDTGDVTIREGEGERRFWKGGGGEGALLASLSRTTTTLKKTRFPKKKSKKIKKKGSELATYIFVDLPSDAPLPAPGSTVTIRGLETASPSIEFPAAAAGGGEGEGEGKGRKGKEKGSASSSFSAEGGEWRESVGSLLFVAKPSSAAGKGASHAATDTPPPGSYLCHTERILSFRKD